ncbi:MAG: hypothetical protein AABY64_07525 [Bdellovibrionota bacterium]
MRSFKSQSGQVLIESVVVFSIASTLFIFLFSALSTATQIFLWHQQINRALLCSLNEKQTSHCLREFSPQKITDEKTIFTLKLVKFKFQRIQHRPCIEVELLGIFDESYKIKKKLSAKNWRV